MYLNVDQMLELVGKVEGAMAPDDLVFLYERASKLPPRALWVEVGAWKGRSFAATCLGAPAGTTLVAIDTWLGSVDEMQNTPFAEAIKGDGPFDAFKKTTSGVSFVRPDLKIGFLRTYSATAAVEMLKANNRADAVFIDGAHDYQSVLDDLRAWSKVLKPGGSLLGHDRNLPGVARALRECKLFEAVEDRGDVIWEGALRA